MPHQAKRRTPTRQPAQPVRRLRGKFKQRPQDRPSPRREARPRKHLAAQLGSGLRRAVGLLLDVVGPGASVGFLAWFSRRGRNWDALPNPLPPFGFPRDRRPRTVAWQRKVANNHAAGNNQPDGHWPEARAHLLLPPYFPGLASNALDCQHPDRCGMGPAVRGVGKPAQPGEPWRTRGRKRPERARQVDLQIYFPLG